MGQTYPGSNGLPRYLHHRHHLHHCGPHDRHTSRNSHWSWDHCHWNPCLLYLCCMEEQTSTNQEYDLWCDGRPAEAHGCSSSKTKLKYLESKRNRFKIKT